ncbi:MAG: hypothetical protein VXX55_13830, partial [Planctomycetota bacterium]|nr:hypothetical protein [Planctomycetota bacterium]
PTGRDLSKVAATSSHRARSLSRSSRDSGTNFKWAVFRRRLVRRVGAVVELFSLIILKNDFLDHYVVRHDAW